MISSNRLEPHGAGQIKVTVDTSGKMGHLEKHVAVFTNDRITPVVTLTVSLDIEQK